MDKKKKNKTTLLCLKILIEQKNKILLPFIFDYYLGKNFASKYCYC